MKHNEKVLQEIIDRVDPHDKLREDKLTIRIAKLYAEWIVKNPDTPTDYSDDRVYTNNERQLDCRIDASIGAGLYPA